MFHGTSGVDGHAGDVFCVVLCLSSSTPIDHQVPGQEQSSNSCIQRDLGCRGSRAESSMQHLSGR